MVTGQSIDLTVPARLVAGTVGEYTARFAFDADWDGYQRTAVFSCNTVEREQLLTDDACIVPWEVLIANGYLHVGVYGAKGDSRLPTVWTARRLFVNPGAGPTQEASEPSPTLVEQLLAKIGNMDSLKTEDKSSLVAAINEVKETGGGGSGGGESGPSYKIGSGLRLDEKTNTLSVDTADKAEQDNTKPITSAAVYMEVGNIEALLAAL